VTELDDRANWSYSQPVMNAQSGLARVVRPVFLVVLWVCLYPIPAAAGIATAVLVSRSVIQSFSIQNLWLTLLVGWVLPAGVGLVVLQLVSRIDHQLAKSVPPVTCFGWRWWWGLSMWPGRARCRAGDPGRFRGAQPCFASHCTSLSSSPSPWSRNGRSPTRISSGLAGIAGSRA